MTVARLILSELAPLVSEQHGVFYINDSNAEGSRCCGPRELRLPGRKHLAEPVHPGEGLVGQCVLEKQRILLTNVPTTTSRSLRSGEAPPRISPTAVIFGRRTRRY